MSKDYKKLYEALLKENSKLKSDLDSYIERVDYLYSELDFLYASIDSVFYAVDDMHMGKNRSQREVDKEWKEK